LLINGPYTKAGTKQTVRDFNKDDNQEKFGEISEEDEADLSAEQMFEIIQLQYMDDGQRKLTNRRESSK
jgi:hypothetical protein